jgi:hypothetical protein
MKKAAYSSYAPPDRDKLTYSWESTGGKLSGKGDAATFDATGVAPGKYTVTATVKDKKHSACSIFPVELGSIAEPESNSRSSWYLKKNISSA